jgi:pyruvate kinase
MRRMRRVKVIATLGPSSSTRDAIKRLHMAGADVFRINMSHTGHEDLARLVHDIRAVEEDVNRPIAILADLQGPKLRVGKFENRAVELATGAAFMLDDNPEPGNGTRVHLPHPEILNAVRPGHMLLLDDGKLRLIARDNDGSRITTEVIVGGVLSDRKGVSLPDTVLPGAALTPKDRADLDAALNAQVDWIALSFVQRADDVAEVRKIARGRAAIMSKIEKPQAIEHIAEILELSDALMVARGDLGVEVPLEKVPGLQKQLTRAARKAGKPVVVATQMLESMITSPVPTRAEVSDVSVAVYEGADAIMLSAESAAGQFPVEAVTTMSRIAEEVERDPNYRPILDAQRSEPEQTGPDAISAAARTVADTLELAAIVCWTASGTTGSRAARERPRTPILALTPRLETARRLVLTWGVHAVLTEDARDMDDMTARACQIVHHEGFAASNGRIIISAGLPFGTPGATNTLRLAYVGEGDGFVE